MERASLLNKKTIQKIKELLSLKQEFKPGEHLLTKNKKIKTIILSNNLYKDLSKDSSLENSKITKTKIMNNEILDKEIYYKQLFKKEISINANKKNQLNDKKYQVNKNNNKQTSLQIYVDGGNSEITSTNLWSLNKIKIALVIFNDKKRIKQLIKDVLILIKIEGDDLSISYINGNDNLLFKDFKINKNDLNENLSINSDIKTVSLNIIRRLLELKALSNYVTENNIKDALLIIDGSLIPYYNNDKKEIEELIKITKLNKCILCGISKTTEMQTNLYRNLNDLVNYNSEKDKKYIFGPFAYYIDNDKNIKINIGIVKLHEKGDYTFRFDYLDDDYYNLKKIVLTISLMSKEPSFLGYPYGLIIADRIARVSNEEINFLKMKFKSFLTNDERTILTKKNAHYFLDNMT